jgi:hypothetical protein
MREKCFEGLGKLIIQDRVLLYAFYSFILISRLFFQFISLIYPVKISNECLVLFFLIFEMALIIKDIFHPILTLFELCIEISSSIYEFSSFYYD